MKKATALLGLLILCILISSCTAGVYDLENISTNEKAGFLLGLWHGAIAPFTFVISLFKDSIAIYEINNNGAWYDFGFILGILSVYSGGSKGSKKIRGK